MMLKLCRARAPFPIFFLHFCLSPFPKKPYAPCRRTAIRAARLVGNNCLGKAVYEKLHTLAEVNSNLIWWAMIW